MTEITGYCPSEGNAERIFRRIDSGIPLIGRYQCATCGDTYSEPNLQRGEENKDLVDLIGEKLNGEK
ncbi:hypothetical protein HY449_04275 [Candidatus Pacearchaeota archaeon]|nr:hypothetical protein [Candidatus Pacearchaeota archaeon]